MQAATEVELLNGIYVPGGHVENMSPSHQPPLSQTPSRGDGLVEDMRYLKQ